jgi:hypothetical protein
MGTRARALGTGEVGARRMLSSVRNNTPYPGYGIALPYVFTTQRGEYYLTPIVQTNGGPTSHGNHRIISFHFGVVKIDLS